MTDRPFAHLSAAELDERIRLNNEQQDKYRTAKVLTATDKRQWKDLKERCRELIAERNRREDQQEWPL